MTLRYLALAISTLVLGTQALAQSDPVDAIVRAEMTKQRIPGVAVAVVRNGDPIKAQGYGEAIRLSRQAVHRSGHHGARG